MSIVRNFLNILIILCACLNWGCCEGAKERGRGKVCSHTIQVGSIFPSSSSSCRLSSKAPNAKSSLRVVHRHGPCSHLISGKATTSPDHVEILKSDQARVNSFHSKLSKKLTTNRVSQSQSTDLPATEWNMHRPGMYVVKIGIGTPKHDLSLLLDTGSYLTWVQCKPCAGAVANCYSQKEPIFDPSSSSSYHNVSCSSPVCDSLGGSVVKEVCSDSTCSYSTSYNDKSTSQGFLATEKFTLTSSDVLDVNFGCGEINKGDYDGYAGILGLGLGELSFPSQTAKTYNNIFSYCLPSSGSYTGGRLTFGSAGISKSVKFTPISSLRGKSYFGLSIVGITVCGKQLKIPSTVFSRAGAIIDSGTIITRLPPKAYAALKNAFKEKMSNYAITSESSNLDTCYDFTGLKTATIPKIAFSFSGGTVVELDPKGILYPLNKTSQAVCLAFAGNSDDSDAAIFGSVQQQTLQVVYDKVGGRVGFAQNGCS